MCMCGICVVVVVCTIDGNLCLSMVILHGTGGRYHFMSFELHELDRKLAPASSVEPDEWVWQGATWWMV